MARSPFPRSPFPRSPLPRSPLPRSPAPSVPRPGLSPREPPRLTTFSRPEIPLPDPPPRCRDAKLAPAVPVFNPEALLPARVSPRPLDPIPDWRSPDSPLPRRELRDCPASRSLPSERPSIATRDACFDPVPTPPWPEEWRLAKLSTPFLTSLPRTSLRFPSPEPPP